MQNKDVRNSKRGVSGALAMMIMIGVTIAVGLGVASYSMGLFSNLSKVAQVKVSSTDLVASTKVLSVTLQNDGGAAVRLNNIKVTIGSTLYTQSPNTTINPASSVTVTSTFSAATFNAGQSYTFTLEFSDGSTQTITTIAR